MTINKQSSRKSIVELDLGLLTVVAAVLLLTIPSAAMAHHPFGGETPTNLFQAVLSGFGHPVIGFDHLAAVIGTGLMASEFGPMGILVPIAFVMTTIAGTGVHLTGIDLPIPEIIIAASVVSFGLIVAFKGSETKNAEMPVFALIAAAIAGAAGVFHGYAYGEAIVGAEMTPLLGYLAGFASIQLVIAGVCFVGMRLIKAQFPARPALVRRFMGLVIGAVGLVFLSSALAA
ncbi:hydrogenase accessory protein [Thalassoporum mexicanum PCC 7367]|uniref:HupE/UreJ family protein n=1 Tax=Thalassoporum mexicanum TaxID=3457544 RepID=UPI00029FC560|nr:HupE/UreJ family protein [Pseudanabaena sp. PCC 7367]AFY69999.1 hydrogenase accessory protein [Pseudanabaena sp. PCC 7367]